MNVLVACEFSGVVRDAFKLRGHNAVSCDLAYSERPGRHLLADVLDYMNQPYLQWDMMIAFPPCTYLCSSGARWWKDRLQLQLDALEFVRQLMAADIPKIAIENPIGKISTAIRKPDQIIQPWMFGHGEVKSTCLWLKGLPPLKHTGIVSGRSTRISRMPESKNRSKERSRTYSGIAEAMAEQWG